MPYFAAVLGAGINPICSAFSEFLVLFKLDTKKSMPRMFFLTEEGSHEQEIVLKLRKNKRLCKRSYVYLVVNI